MAALQPVSELPKNAKPVPGTYESLPNGRFVQRFEQPDGTAYEVIRFSRDPEGPAAFYRIEN